MLRNSIPVTRRGGCLALLIGLASVTPFHALTPDPLPPLIQAAPTFDSVAALVKERRCPDAAVRAKELLATIDAAGDGETLQAAKTIDLLVEGTWRCHLPDPEAGALAARAIATKERLLGPNDPEVATSYHQLGNFLGELKEIQGAKEAYERALAIREQAFGVDALEIVPTLNNLGQILRGAGDYAAARPYLARALAIREKRLAPEHPDVATSLQSLALLIQDSGDYDGADPLFRRALAIREKVLDPLNPQLSGTINNLAVLAQLRGDSRTAEELFTRAIEIERKRPQPDKLMIAMHTGNLAEVRMAMGDLRAARELEESALKGVREAAPSDRTYLGIHLNNLGYLLYLTGDYGEAEKLLKEALEVRRGFLPPRHRSIAETLGNLGSVALKKGEIDRAGGFHEESLEIRRATLGPDHPVLAEAMNNVALVRAQKGDLAAAENLHREALVIQRKALGPEHPEVALTLRNLAVCEIALGHMVEAEPLLNEAMRIEETAYGPSHPAVGATAAVLAGLEYRTGRSSLAFDTALRVEAIGRDLVTATARALPERQGLALAASRPAGNDLALSVALQGRRDAAIARRVWDSVIRSRGLIFDEMAARHHVTADSSEPEVARLRGDLASARERLASLAQRGAGGKPADPYRRLFDSTREEKEKIERALADRSASFRDEVQDRDLGFDAVQRALPASSALVAYVRFNRDASSAPSYAAFVMRSGVTQPEIHLLGDAGVIDDLVNRWRRAVATEPSPLPGAREIAERDYIKVATALRRALWDPFASRLEGTKTVLIVPDGALSFVNFNTLPLRPGTYLVEKGPILHYLSAERDLARSGVDAQRGKGLLVVSAPEYEARPDEITEAELKTDSREVIVGGKASSPAAGFRGAISSCQDFASLRFDPLPGTDTEARGIAKRWTESSATSSGEPLFALSGAAASEGEFKSMAAGKRILHLATHGFVVGGSCAEDNPLLLSGLALAGVSTITQLSPRSRS